MRDSVGELTLDWTRDNASIALGVVGFDRAGDLSVIGAIAFSHKGCVFFHIRQPATPRV